MAQALLVAAGMSPAGQRNRIVLVDDEEALVWSLASRLSKVRPHDQVETAHDGASALTLFARDHVDLLVADVRMPGLSGIDLALAARKELPTLPVILMTAFKSPEIERIRTGPFTELLEKPFEFDRFIQLVESALSLGQVGFSGAISVQTLPDVVQLYALSSATGKLTVRHASSFGELWFVRGELVHALTPRARGDDAVYETMTWSGGAFSMLLGATTSERSVASSWQELLMESCRRLDEARRGDDRVSHTGWTLAPPSADNDAMFASLFAEPAQAADAPDPPEPAAAVADPRSRPEEETNMNIKDSLAKLNQVDGFVGAALVDSESGMMLGQEGGGAMNLEIAAAGNTEVVRSKRKVMANLGLKDAIEDILISLGKQYHLIRPLRGRPNLFFYLAIDRARANLAMARIALADVEKDLQV